MSKHFLNWCMRTLEKPRTERKKFIPTNQREPQPQDAVKKFGVKPEKSAQMDDYLAFRKMANISSYMISKVVILSMGTIHNHFRAGRYARLDSILDLYKDECSDWKTHQRPRVETINARFKKKHAPTLKIINEVGSTREMLDGLGMKGRTITFIAEIIDVHPHTIGRWFKAKRADNIDEGISLFHRKMKKRK